MSHSVTAKLNKDARQHQNAAGMTFFVSLGEQNYNFKTKQKEWTNYDAAIFAKDGQIQFYADSLKAGAVISVVGTGLIIELDPTGQYPPKLAIQDAKIEYLHSDQPAQAPQQGYQQPQMQQQAPQMQQPQQMPVNPLAAGGRTAADYAPQPQAAPYDQDMPF